MSPGQPAGGILTIVKLNRMPLSPKSTAIKSGDVHCWQNMAGPKTDAPHELHLNPVKVPVLASSLVIWSLWGSIETGVTGESLSGILPHIIQGH